MRTRSMLLIAAGLVAVAVGGMQAQVNDRPAPKAGDAAEVADRAAIQQTARDFAAAFAKGDATAAALHWTEQGEYHGTDGAMLRGRAAIEQAMKEHFQAPGRGKLDVRVGSIRFLSRDSAVEEGMIHVTPSSAGLPSSTLYSSVHVRENGQWKLALSREFGAGQDRCEDLEWLVGTWRGGPAGNEVTLTFARDEQHGCITGTVVKTTAGKATAPSTMRIALDPQRGQLRSWHFDANGGHSQALWLRDGTNWVMDVVGTDANGNEYAAVNLLGRVNDNQVTWRSIDRVAGQQPLPDTAPIKLTRSAEGK